MTFDKLFSVIKDDVKAQSLISNISCDTFEVPFIMRKTVEMLSDDSALINIITEGNKRALSKMLLMYFDACWSIYIDDNKLDNKLKFGKLEIYKIEAFNGLRYATAKEVAQGVKGLIAEHIYPAGENEYKILCLLNWTFTGNSYYFREAGYKLTFDNSKQPKESLYEMIMMCANHMIEMFKFCSSEDFELALKRIDKMKKNNGYKYASYERDEIEESISIKQLIYNIDKTFPRNSEDAEYRKAIALVIKGKSNIKALSPLDISFLRKVYDKKALDKNADNNNKEAVEKLRKECELLLSERYSGKLKAEHFAFKIIETLKRNAYKTCSKKQYDIIQDALNELNKHNNKMDNEEMNNSAGQLIMDDEFIDNALGNIDAEDMLNLSNALGSGLFDNDEEES